MKTRTGKIARLPREIREQLNRRLQDGEPGKRLVDWLNALPQVRSLLATEFSGRPVSEQNLSEWKQGGYREWEAHQRACEVVGRLAEQGSELEEAAGSVPMSERLAGVLTAELVHQTQELLGATGDPAERWQRLREALDKLAQLRREESNARRLQLEQQRWQARRGDTSAKAKRDELLAPLHTILLHRAFTHLMETGSPDSQVMLSQYLDRVVGKLRDSQARSNPSQPTAFKVDQVASSTVTPADQTESNPIKPNQTG